MAKMARVIKGVCPNCESEIIIEEKEGSENEFIFTVIVGSGKSPGQPEPGKKTKKDKEGDPSEPADPDKKAGKKPKAEPVKKEPFHGFKD